MSPTPNDATGAADDEAPQTAPAPVDDKTLSITVGAFVVFIATWIGSKMAGTALPSAGFGGTDLRLAQIVLVLIAGVAAVRLGRSLKSMPRSVFLVITVFYFAFAALAAVFTGQFTSVEVESRFFAIVRLVHFIADLIYPLIVAQVLAVTVSRVGAALGGTDVDADSAGTCTGRLEKRAARSGKAAAIVLFAVVAVIIVVWILRQPITAEPLLSQSGDVIGAVAAALGSVAAVYALRAVAVARSLPAEQPAVGRDLSRTRPHLAHTLTFLTIAAGLYLCRQYAIISVDFGAGLGGGYPFGPVGLLVFTIGSFGLAVITFDAVTQRRKAPADPK